MGVLKPELIFKSIVPIIMAGILGIYGLIVSVILSGKSKFNPLFNSLLTHSFTIVGAAAGAYTEAMGYKHLASGLCCGLSSLVIILSSYWRIHFRLLVSLSVLLVMQESEQTPNKARSSLVWFWSLSSLRLSVYMVWLSPLSSPKAEQLITFKSYNYKLLSVISSLYLTINLQIISFTLFY